MTEEYAAEFDRCEEMDALAQPLALAGQGGEFEPTAQTSRDGISDHTWNGLKRKTPLQAKTPLKAKTGLQRKTPLKAKTPLQSKPAEGDGSTWNGLKRNSTLQTKTPLKAKSPMKPKPSRRRYGHLVKNGWCAVCGKAGETEWHHIIYRSHGGDEADENMLEVCRECHEKIHARLISPDEVAFARLTAGSYLEENRRVTTYGA